MREPVQGQQDVNNVYATGDTWFGDRQVAEDYANSTWGRKNGYKVFDFRSVRPLRLLRLEILQNWREIFNRMEQKVMILKKNMQTIVKQVSDEAARSRALSLVAKEIQEIEIHQQILGLTVGFNKTFSEQIDMMLKYGQTFTNDYSYDPREQKQRRYGNRTDLDSYRFTNNAVKAPNGIAVITNESKFGGGVDELNRISFTTALDAIMCEAIQKYVNVDGYIASDMPSLFHANASLEAEVALFAPRGAMELLGRTPGSGPM